MSQARHVDLPTKAIATPMRAVSAHNTESDIELVAVVVSIIDNQPMVRVVGDGNGGARLPSAQFSIDSGQALEACLRESVARESSYDLGYVEQLHCMSVAPSAADDHGKLSIGYLALAHGADQDGGADTAHWRSWYQFFPWEDWRRERPQILREMIEPRLRAWAEAMPEPDLSGLSRIELARMLFGFDGAGWDEERVVERHDLLARAGLLDADIGLRVAPHHRRTLALAVGRLRSKIKSRPVIFELMPELFTLFELQRTVEAILGPHLHKQNFRRLVEHMGLVEPTEEIKSHTGGRPAKLFRFRQSVLLERLQPGVRVRAARH